MTAPASVIELVDRFATHNHEYQQHKNETELRREFLDPLFRALGWDVFNDKGLSERFKEVIHEASVEVEGQAKAADYAFRAGDKIMFFVEAKKPSVKIETHPEPAFQLRRYGWSAKLPISILTDFEQLAIYDCRAKPDKTDKASQGRIHIYHYAEYVEKWDEIAAIFSREAVLNGSFEQFVERNKDKKATTEVDDDFLAEIERWRELLARNLALNNPGIRNERELNYAVQMTIDRIVFLRICEDRGIERFGQIRDIANPDPLRPTGTSPKSAASNPLSPTQFIADLGEDGRGSVYAGLCQLFKQADARYNSGLFHFADEKGQSSSADTLTPTLKIDDDVLQDIVRNLYYPDSPYAFSYISADILGQVYERFLGKVVRLTADHNVEVSEKPEVRKAGGVYYTPVYIVDYIVKNTVGKLFEGKTPRDVAGIKVLDPACGSGSFLLGAYQYLLDWYLKYYSETNPQQWAKGKNPVIYQKASLDTLPPISLSRNGGTEGGGGGGWELTTAEKKRILLAHIHGVDIDAQAVEVTKLSLLLKVLESESEQSIGSQLSLLRERVLPDLGRNIQCGNSLIGPDYYEGHQLGLGMFDEEEHYRVNAFNWQAAFPQVFMQGGFDAVIGNPPYVRQEELSASKEYFRQHYKTYLPTADLYVNFIEKEIGILKPNGLFGMIVSNKWLRAAYGEPLRKFLTKETTLLQVVDLAGLPVFEGATVRTVILICSPTPNVSKTFQYLAPLNINDFRKVQSGNDLQIIFDQNATALSLAALKPEGWSFANKGIYDLLSTLQRMSIPITQYIKGKYYFGIKTGFNKAFVIDQTTRDLLIATDPISENIIKPMFVGKDVRRYHAEFANSYLIWTYIGVPIEKYPAIFAHLKQYEAELQKRWDKGNHWWELRACDYYEKFEVPKIIYPDIATSCRFYLDEEGYFGTNTTYFIPSNDKYLLGILNSKLAQFFFTQVCAGLEGSGTIYLRFFGQYIQDFPVHVINFSDPAEKSVHDRLVGLVEQMLALHKRQARTPQEQEMLTRQIAATDESIDKLVYSLYGLTDDEIKIVEGKS